MAAEKKRINTLIAEDNPDDAELVILQLKRYGFQPQAKVVETEKEFSEELENGDWDIIICDFSMPTFDALRAIEVRKKHSIDIPFILVSGTVGEEIAVEAMRSGADDYVMKDNLNRLGAAVDRELKNRELRKEKKWAEQKYRLLFQNSLNGVMLCDEQGTIMEANEATCSMLNVSWQNLPQVNVFDRLTSYQSDQEIDLQKRLKQEGGVQTELGLVQPDGRKTPVAVSAGLLNNQFESPIVSLILTDITDRVVAEDKLKNSLNEKQVLLSEIHHRVKNNMAIVSGLLYMQSEYVDDSGVKQYFREAVSRIKSMAAVHEQLYRSESFNEINFKDYIHELAKHIQSGLLDDRKNIRINVDCSNIKMNLNKAIPCGLIVHELITNAYLHGYGDRSTGEIRVRLNEENKKYILDVEDDGAGFEHHDAVNKPESMGMMIIKSLVNQLNAEMEVDGNQGTHIRLLIPSK